MTDLATIVALILTLCILSFLYRENPFYRFAEHLLIGVSVGYSLVVICRNTIYPLVIERLTSSGDLLVVIPTCLGLLMFSRLRRGWSSLSRIPLALMIGFGAGVSIPAMLQARVLRQVASSMQSLATIDGIVIVCGVISTMSYFYFSRRQVGFFGRVAKLGTYFLMVFFGATFGFTVMSRISLLIGRLEFILRDAFGVVS